MLRKASSVKSIIDKQIPSLGRWKCEQQDPRKHDKSHVGLFYQYPKDPAVLSQMFSQGTIFHGRYDYFLKTIDMIPVMVRQPALTVMDKMRENLTKTENEQIIIYGDPGHGKTHTLAHILHYNYLLQDRFLIHMRWIHRFTRDLKEFKVSTSRPGRIDTPLDSVMMLQNIKTQNQSYLEKFRDSLVCSQDYRWSAREETKAGEPLESIIDHGINRVIHSSDCLAVLFKELMLGANQGKIRLMTVIKNVNYLFNYKGGLIKHPDHKWVTIDEITVARSLKKLVKGDYKNSLLIVTCDDGKSKKQNQTPESVFPEDGLSYFERAQRVLVPKYSRNEFENCYDFYQDIGWLARPESRTQQVRDEVRFLSGLNPAEVFEICKSL